MKTIVFVCHGNICRSVAAEYIAKHYVSINDKSKDYLIYSRATTNEEIGNDIYPPMKRALAKYNIPFSSHKAKRISQEDYDNADIIFYMDEENKYDLQYMFSDNKRKIKPITIYDEHLADIADPWYSNRFDEVVEQLRRCIEEIFTHLWTNNN